MSVRTFPPLQEMYISKDGGTRGAVGQGREGRGGAGTYGVSIRRQGIDSWDTFRRTGRGRSRRLRPRARPISSWRRRTRILFPASWWMGWSGVDGDRLGGCRRVQKEWSGGGQRVIRAREDAGCRESLGSAGELIHITGGAVLVVQGCGGSCDRRNKARAGTYRQLIECQAVKCQVSSSARSISLERNRPHSWSRYIVAHEGRCLEGREARDLRDQDSKGGFVPQ